MIIKSKEVFEKVEKVLHEVTCYREEVEGRVKDKVCKVCFKRFPATSTHFVVYNGIRIGGTCRTCLEEMEDLRKLNYREEWNLILHRRKMDFCAICGYDKCSAALDFHHLEPLDKEMNLGGVHNRPVTKEILGELDKCICLCSNCHRELHYKLYLGLLTGLERKP